MSIFQTEIKKIAANAPLFKEEKMIVLFGDNAPVDLADYCYNIIINPLEGSIQPGQSVHFDNQTYIITAVGNVVEKNLTNLGHITLRFDGATDAELAGTLYLEAKELPEIKVGTQIRIEN